MTTGPSAERDRAHTSTPGGLVAPDAARDLDALVRDDALLDAAVAAAQRDAARYHGLLGQPIVVWRDGRLVEEVPSAGADANTLQDR